MKPWLKHELLYCLHFIIRHRALSRHAQGKQTQEGRDLERLGEKKLRNILTPKCNW